MTVDKSFVYGVFKKQQRAIFLKKQTIKQKKPRTYPINQLWQIDLTQLFSKRQVPVKNQSTSNTAKNQTTSENNTLTLGIIDAGVLTGYYLSSD